MDRRSVFVVGDSISIHYGPYLEKMISGKFNYDRKGNIKDALKNLDKPAGANAGDSRMVLEYLNDEYKNGTEFDILLLNCGLHDIRVNRDTGNHQVNEQDYFENLNKIFDTAARMSNKVIWITSTPVIDEIHNNRIDTFLRYNKDLILYNSIAAKATAEYGIPVIDLYTFTKSLGDDIYYDHVHFTEEVRTLQAAFISGYLLNAGV